MKRFIFILLISFLIAGCTPPPRPMQNFNTDNLSALESLTSYDSPVRNDSGLNHIRINALKEAALTLGAQAGLAAQAKEINQMLKTDVTRMDEVFNFRALLLNHNVLPPVLEQGNQLLNLANPDTIRIADKTYKIVSQAHFVTAPPNWRNYIWMNYQKPTVPDHTLLPCNEEERVIWIKYIRKGWKQGIQQANIIYHDELARMKRDYNGMVLYRDLLAKNMVSRPYVALSNLGITSNKQDTQLFINDKVLRITALPKLNPQSSTWRPVLTNVH